MNEMRRLMKLVEGPDVGVIPSWWRTLHPYGRMDPPYWLDVLDAVKAAGIDPKDATAEDVKAAMASLVGKEKEVRDRAKAERARANEFILRAQEIEDRELPRHVRATLRRPKIARHKSAKDTP